MGNEESNEFEENFFFNNRNLTELSFIPSQESIIKRLYLSFNQISTLPKEMNELILIDLSSNKIISSLPDQIAEALSSYPSLNQLLLNQNQLETLNNLQSSSLQVFHMNQNRFNQFPDQLFSKFPQLQALHFDCNFLNALSNLKSNSIQILSFSLNCIETIDLATLDFPQLVSLDLSKNRITKIPNNFAKSFPNLKILYLNDNLISEITEINDDDDPVFPNTLNLLNLSNNLLEKIPNSITKIPHLTSLNIENNQITHIPQLNSTLVEFKASNNKISTIEDQELRFLKDIILFNNEIKTFPTQIKALIRNNSIIAHRNQIEEINFGDVPIKEIISTQVTVINLSFNQIKSIPKELFEELPNLQTFSAFFNKITEIPSEISNCQNLLNLNISHNPIKKLPKLPDSLVKLTASNCQIETFDENISSNLKFIDLSGNNLEHFTSFSSIQVLNLSQNKIKEMPSVTENMQILDLSMNEIETAPCFITCLSVTDLNLSSNRLTRMPQICLAPLLQYLEISENPIKGEIDISNLPLLRRIDIAHTEIEITGTNEKLNEIISSNRNKENEEEERTKTNEKLNESITSNKEKEEEDDDDEQKANINEKLNESITPNKDKENEEDEEEEDDDDDEKVKTSEKFNEIISSNKNKDKKEGNTIYIYQENCGNGYKSGYSEFLGMRSSMEDSVIIRDDLNLYAVCDGHGGPNTAKFASIHIADQFERGLEDFSYEKATDFVSETILKVEDIIQNMKLEDGSTLCLAFICTDESNGNRKIVTGHLGDSRALIVRSNGEARELTRDHRPSMRSELERVHNEFGCVSKENRVDSVLAVTRSIGDFDVHSVGREPELNEFELDDDDKFLVICCDGVFDVLTNDDVAKLVVNASSANEAAYTIRNAAFSSLSNDNISSVVVDLRLIN